MKFCKVTCFYFLLALLSYGKLQAKPFSLKLWNDDCPGIIKNAGPEKNSHKSPYARGYVSVPSMLVYLPPKEKATGIAIIYCSGGSYRTVSYMSDRTCKADYFMAHGVAVIVLKYRTIPPSKSSDDAIQDGLRAVRIVRANADKWNIDPAKIGMLGGSAGANLILNAAVKWDKGKKNSSDPVKHVSSRPDFIVTLSLWPGKQHPSVFKINKETPPALICTARDDRVASTNFSESIATKYRKAGIPVKLWSIPKGGHPAFRSGHPGAGWVDLLWPWLKKIGILKK